MSGLQVFDADALVRVEHDWPRDAPACRALQTELTRHVVFEDRLGPVRTIGGVDIGFEDQGRITRAAVVVLDARTLTVVDQALARVPTRMPYIPGLLSFREVPGALAALSQLAHPPDLLHVDGHGIAHPRRLGVATHLGLVSGLPTLGVAKKRLTGHHEPLPDEYGAWVSLIDRGETVGAVLRSRVGVKPIFISGGHGIGLETAIASTRSALTGYKLPATTRAADRLASDRG
ncbi:deoxyribonuclease V [Salinisphaera sp. T31B1]|uniref:deoxyribonuclease V n=1 Tax=Salinisphaera sp. T31B1 TaxID=727963 RepID=UPI003340B3DB